jgi:hypothetical protein
MTCSTFEGLKTGIHRLGGEHYCGKHRRTMRKVTNPVKVMMIWRPFLNRKLDVALQLSTEILAYRNHLLKYRTKSEERNQMKMYMRVRFRTENQSEYHYHLILGGIPVPRSHHRGVKVQSSYLADIIAVGKAPVTWSSMKTK